MNGSGGEFGPCAVCGRTILRGERAVAYLDTERVEVSVCVLCMPRAEASGWIPAAQASAVAPPPPVRRRGGTALLERLARRNPRPTEVKAPEDGSDRDNVASPAAASADSAAPAADRAVVEPEPEPLPTPPSATDVFNASSEVRKVAGLRKSLGEPRVSVRNVSRGEDVITIGWELSWYQWSVGRGRIQQIAKGNEISELPIEDRAWNAELREDGTIAVV